MEFQEGKLIGILRLNLNFAGMQHVHIRMWKQVYKFDYEKDSNSCKTAEYLACENKVKEEAIFIGKIEIKEIMLCFTALGLYSVCSSNRQEAW